MIKSMLFIMVAATSISSTSLLAVDVIVVGDDANLFNMLNVSSVRTYVNSVGGSLEIQSLDEVSRLEKLISKRLPKDPKLAKKELGRRIDRGNIKDKFISAYAAEITVVKYRLTQKPAIIFDGKFVVYGEFDLSRALNVYLEKRDAP